MFSFKSWPWMVSLAVAASTLRAGGQETASPLASPPGEPAAASPLAAKAAQLPPALPPAAAQQEPAALAAKAAQPPAALPPAAAQQEPAVQPVAAAPAAKPAVANPTPGALPMDRIVNPLLDNHHIEQVNYDWEEPVIPPAAAARNPYPLHSLLMVYDPEVAAARESLQAEERFLEMPVDPEEPTRPRLVSPGPKKWYDKLSLRGYTQTRFNQTVSHVQGSADPNYVADGSVGENKNFLIRRCRLIIQGDLCEHVYFYFQPDFAVTPPGSPDATHFLQIRDMYGDIYVDTTKIHRFRVGQSKVPYGWETLQSSSNRIAIDRDDAINSGVKNERDLGIFYYWTPLYAQKLFRYVLAENLKGTGNYGMFGLGVYNGQGGSFVEQNENVHVVSRLTVPYQFENGQIMELSVQGYTGRYTPLTSSIRPLGMGDSYRPTHGLDGSDPRVAAGLRDERLAWTAVLYPQPIGFQAEWTIGRGPGLSDDQLEIQERALYGGYLMMMGKIDMNNYGLLYPFVRYQRFHGGWKAERNAPFGDVNDYQCGCEWQITPAMELVTEFTIADRTSVRSIDRDGEISYRQFEGNLLRFQFQVNY